MDESDAELVARMARGDRGALSQLYRRHASVLLGVAFGILRSRSEAEDVVHDAFLESWTRADAYSPERGSVKAWLVVRTRARSVDRLRACVQARRRDADSMGKAGPAEQASEMDIGVLRRVQTELASLPEEQQTVLQLGYFEDLSCSEIAARLGIPLGTVKSRARLALAQLRAVLRDDLA
jgi:RNA polymerase sigma-70 factor (ECF subfamily)